MTTIAESEPPDSRASQLDSLADELAALESERAWYMATQVPDLHKRLLLRLHEVLAQLRGPSHPYDGNESNGAPTIDDDGYIPIVSANGTINGYVLVKGVEVTKAELKVKMFKLRKGEEITMEILPVRPLPMTQLEDAYLCLEIADRRLRTLEFGEDARCDVISPPPPPLQHGHVDYVDTTPATVVDMPHTTIDSVSTAISVFSEVLGNMNDAIAHLRRRIVHSFPLAKSYRMRDIYVPQCPDDLHIDIAVSGSDITITAFALRGIKPDDEAEVLTDSQIFDDEQFKRALGGALSGGLYIDAMGMPIRTDTPSPPARNSSNPKSRLTRSDTDGNLVKISNSVQEGLSKLGFGEKKSEKVFSDQWWKDSVHPSHHPIGLGAGDEEPVYDPQLFAGEIVEFGSSTVKVLEVAETSYPLPQIRSCIRSLEEAITLSRRLIDMAHRVSAYSYA